jgi:Zn-dependent protease
MNVLLATLLSLLYLGLARFPNLAGFNQEIVGFAIGMNIRLALFNMIPVPPLDGRSVVFWFLPERNPMRQFLTQFGPFIFLMLIVTPLGGMLFRPIALVGELWMAQLNHWVP